MALHNIPEGIAIAVILFSRGFVSSLISPLPFLPFQISNFYFIIIFIFLYFFIFLFFYFFIYLFHRMSMTVVTTWVTMSHMPQPVFAVIAYLYLGTQYKKTMLPLGFVIIIYLLFIYLLLFIYYLLLFIIIYIIYYSLLFFIILIIHYHSPHF